MILFEDQTFETILGRSLDRIPDDIDKREGSIIYDALAPAALEVAQVYHLMSIMYRLIFGETTDGDMLELRAANFGVYRKRATASIRRGIFRDSEGNPMEIDLGSRFSSEGITFEVVERISAGNYLLRAETLGEIGNQVYGVLLPIESMDGLGSAEITEVLVPGLDEQNDESLFEALKEKQSRPSSSGNAYEYEQWAKEIRGIYGAQVYEQWDGPNTVKVVLMDTERRSPAPLVIEQVYDHIESVRPVGAIVTVVGVNERVIGVTVEVTLRTGTDIELTNESITENITKYFMSIASEEDTVRYTSIGNAILDGFGVIDYSNLALNGTTSNVILNADDVPVLGTLTIGG